ESILVIADPCNTPRSNRRRTRAYLISAVAGPCNHPQTAQHVSILDREQFKLSPSLQPAHARPTVDESCPSPKFKGVAYGDQPGPRRSQYQKALCRRGSKSARSGESLDATTGAPERIEFGPAYTAPCEECVPLPPARRSGSS